MGCCGGRDEEVRLREEQKWDYINLNDFTTKSCWIPVSYMILYFNVMISLAVYALDTFTAVNLLAFSRWSSQIKPAIPLDISKWIFAGCIIFSLVLLVYRWLRAIRVIKSGGIAQCYLDPIAVKVQSIRTSKRASGWRRFLVFAELTKSRKGADYVAIFTYFNFEAWLRVIFAQGPRQVINGITLYSVAQLNLIPIGEHAAPEGTSAVSQFFINIEALAEKDRLQALILFSMLFTLVIWAFEFLSFCVAVLLYLLFLWHHIPSEDGTLSVYCRRKINRRLERIVKKKVDKALTNAVVLQDRKRTNTDLETGVASIKRNPTLPTLPSVMDLKQPQQPKLPEMPPLSRQTTVTTLPPYRPQTSNTDRPPPLPEVDWDAHNHEHDQYDNDYNDHDHDQHGGHVMASSNSMHPTQYSDDASASLVNNAGGIGYSPPSSQYNYRPPHHQQQHHQRDPMQREYTKTPMLPPLERYGTPLSVSTAPVFNAQGLGQGRRTPGPMTPGPGPGPRTPGPMMPGPGPRTPGSMTLAPGPRTPGPLTPGPGSMGRQTPSSHHRQQQQKAWDAPEVPDLPVHSPQPTLPSISRPGTAFAPPPPVSTPAPSFNRDRERERYGPYDGPQMSSVPQIPSAPTPTPSAPPTHGNGAPYRNFARPSLAPYSAPGGQDMPPRSETAPLPSQGQYSHSQVGYSQAGSQGHGQQPDLQQEPQLPQIQPPNGTQNGSYPSFNP
ncbi:hypothetical protein H101_04430 [Trichophyton interdigitale H6]|nr:hypothetical protein H101_04430 [Trichophyton interdigitale H6]